MVCFAELGRGKVMVAGSLIAKRSLYEDKIRRLAHREDLPFRGHAHEQFTSGGEQLFRDQNRKGGANGASDDTELHTTELEPAKHSVVASPSLISSRPALGQEAVHDIAVRVENADGGNRVSQESFLPSCLTQQILWTKN